MKIVILGGGVVGVTTAHQLLRDGHEVEVLERAGLPGSGASWGNAGMISPCAAFTWSGSRSLASRLTSEHGRVLTPSLDWRLYPWLWARLRESDPETAERNARAEMRLCEYSRRVLTEVSQTEGIDYERNAHGILYLYRRASEFEAAVERLERLETRPEDCRPLDRAGVLGVEPQLAGAIDAFAGAVLRERDETGNPAKFTRALAERIVQMGGALRTGVTVGSAETRDGEVTSVETDHGRVRADAFVIALGSESARFARRLGLDLPIYPLKGYSLTASIEDFRRAPGASIVDGENGVAISRFGGRLRVAGAAEAAGYDTSHRPADFSFMRGVAERLYPGVADYEHCDMWAGLGPTTPSGLPILGTRKYRNLYVNAGHGHKGWATSHGSARIIADLIARRDPAISLEGLHA